MRVVVAVPVKNEADRIEACFSALVKQKLLSADRIVFLINNTSDDTANIFNRLSGSVATPIEIVEHKFPPEEACAGAARRMAMERAAVIAGDDGVLLTTDADGRVAPDWIDANLFHLRQGVDAVAGRVNLDPADEALIPTRLLEDDLLERSYATALDEIKSIVCPQTWDPWPRHTEHSGASIAVTVPAYRKAGGMPAVSIAEDRRFFDALMLTGARVRHAPEVTVTVSGRMVGRAEGGMADTIRRRMHRPDPYLDDALEPAIDFYHRLQGKLMGTRRLVAAETVLAELASARRLIFELKPYLLTSLG